MSQPFEVSEDGKVRIVGVQINDNAQLRWRAIISEGSKSHVMGFIFERVQCEK